MKYVYGYVAMEKLKLKQCSVISLIFLPTIPYSKIIDTQAVQNTLLVEFIVSVPRAFLCISFCIAYNVFQSFPKVVRQVEFVYILSVSQLAQYVFIQRTTNYAEINKPFVRIRYSACRSSIKTLVQTIYLIFTYASDLIQAHKRKYRKIDSTFLFVQ